MTFLRVSVITEAERAHYRRDIGESWFCDYFNFEHSSLSCDGLAEIRVGKLMLCRSCSADLADVIRDAIEMTDLADRAKWA
jgi:hypothetical protein